MPAIYTRTGDKGDTGLFGGSRVAKQSARVEAYGTVDEANAHIGHAKQKLDDERLQGELHEIQQRLFTLGAEIASDERGASKLDNLVGPDDVAHLESLIDACLAETGPQRSFVVPGRDEGSSTLHIARTVVRRAERRVLTASETSPIRPEVVKYLNRLSDCLYAIARVCEERHTRRQVESIVRRTVAAMNVAERGDLTCFTLEVATRMAQAAQQKAGEMGVPIVFVAVDAAGNPMLLHRMEGSLLGSIALAGDKAWTASAFRSPTHLMKDRAKESGDLFGLEGSSSGRICVFGGGFPVFVDGLIAGGIGVSGGTVEEDMAIAGHALSTALEEE